MATTVAPNPGARTLKLAGIPYKTVIRSAPDSILFLDGEGAPRTAWIHRNPDGPPGIWVSHEQGFVDWPSPEIEMTAVLISSTEETTSA